MSEFVYLFRTTQQSREARMGTPERAQEAMQVWMRWVQTLEADGHVKPGGQPLEMGGAVLRGRDRAITDGPFVEVKDVVAGFMTIEARNLAHATELASGCPMLDGDGSVEIRPVVRMSY